MPRLLWIVVTTWSLAAFVLPTAAQVSTDAANEDALLLEAVSQPGGGVEGLLVPGKQVRIASVVDGELGVLEVEEGDRVEKGQMLAKLDDRLQQARVEVAELNVDMEAQMRQVQLAAEEAEITYEQSNTAFENDAASEWEVRRAKLQWQQQQAQLDQLKKDQRVAKATLEFEKRRLEQFWFEAPFAGRIVQIATEEGATLTRGDPVMVLVSLNPLRAELFLPAKLHHQLDQDQSYQLKAGPPVNTEIIGRLKFIDPRIDSASETFRCVFEVDNADEKLPSGVTVQLVSPDAVKPNDEQN